MDVRTTFPAPIPSAEGAQAPRSTGIEWSEASAAQQLEAYRTARDEFLNQILAAVDRGEIAAAYDQARAAVTARPRNLGEKAKAIYAMRALPYLAVHAQKAAGAHAVLREIAMDPHADMECRRMALASIAGAGLAVGAGLDAIPIWEPDVRIDSATRMERLVWDFAYISPDRIGSVAGPLKRWFLLAGNLRAEGRDDADFSNWLLAVVLDSEPHSAGGLRQAALTLLAALPSTNISATIAPLVDSETDQRFRRAVALALQHLADQGDQGAAELLAARATSHFDPGVRAVAIPQLVRFEPHYSTRLGEHLLRAVDIPPPVEPSSDIKPSDRQYAFGAKELAKETFKHVIRYYADEEGSPAVRQLALDFFRRIATWGEAAPLSMLALTLQSRRSAHMPVDEFRDALLLFPDSAARRQASKIVEKLAGR